METAMPFVVRLAGQTHLVNTLEGLALRDLEPARGFVSRATSRNRPNRPFLYGSGRHIEVESEAEAIEAHLADRDPEVQYIVPQGAWVKSLVQPVGSSDKAHRWGWACVDFILGYRNGAVAAVEVKRFDYDFKKRPAAKLLATAYTCARAGVEYRVMAGLSTRERLVFWQLHGSRRSQYLALPSHDLLRARMLERADEQAVTFGELRTLGVSTITATLIWELLWLNVLCVDWSARIASTSPIRVHGRSCAQAGGTSAWDFVCGPRREDMLPELREWVANL